MDNQVISLQKFRAEQQQPPSSGQPRVVTVTGGKGGVGKSFVATNLAALGASAGTRTLAVDADFAMADLNLMLGVAPERSVLDVLTGTPIGEVLVRAHGVDLLPGLNGNTALANLDAHDRRAVLQAIDSLEDAYELCVIDAPPGIGDTASDMAAAASHVVVVLSAEPVSLADAYSCIKALCVRHGLSRAYVVPNNVASADEAGETFERLNAIVERFLGIELVALPYIPHDRNVTRTCALGVPLVSHVPDAPAARAIREVARVLATAPATMQPDPIRLFRSRLPCEPDPELCRTAEVSEL